MKTTILPTTTTKTRTEPKFKSARGVNPVPKEWLWLALSSLLLGVCPSSVLAQSFTTFDVPGAACTYAVDINNSGTVAGYYCDSNFGATHGFVRAPSGAITTFDPPGSISTGASSINQGGTVTGSYYGADGLSRGFVREPDGTITRFHGPSQNDPPLGTSPECINQFGVVVGSWEDPNVDETHGFVREPSGAIKSVDVQIGLHNGGTEAHSISPTGEITGYWSGPPDFVSHGFVRTWGGAITSFDAPGATDTFSRSINQLGSVAGDYSDSNGNHGFVRASDGTFTTVDAAGAGTGPGQGTSAFKINRFGAVTGHYLDANNVLHGFVRAFDGTFTVLDAPGAGTGPFEGTSAWSINDFGLVTGTFVDANFSTHGFVALTIAP